ncbi:50S ribosomal protein L33 [Buchnera aphidicola (Schlechtendalia chinensis)]|uniref:Large ribosomal subunit protein bL33 n=1 Tax=Buchnera aphidicola subsp. Schlechtendalia chinensis TaxID=118110 RepID=A0A172WD59_BUCSC|nr:50S ribosomal protein L33 [Buchnera aphidicola]ANF16895.1 50S ribosomal protein L33 [Buchnera aphidicola (Schlechtendalia chinensis)]
MAKNSRNKIKLVSSSGSKHYYTTTKNKKSQTQKLKLKKYDPIVKKHVLYLEHKIK